MFEDKQSNRKAADYAVGVAVTLAAVFLALGGLFGWF